MTPNMPQVQPRHKECDFPKAIVHPLLTLIFTDEGTRYVKPTDHLEGLGGNTITVWGKHAKRTDPKVLQIC